MIWVEKEREGGRRKGGEQVDKKGEKTRKQGKELEIKKVLSDKATWYNEKCCTDANRRLAVRLYFRPYSIFEKCVNKSTYTRVYTTFYNHNN